MTIDKPANKSDAIAFAFGIRIRRESLLSLDPLLSTLGVYINQ